MSEERSLIMLSKDFAALEELLVETEGELNPTLEQWMQINEQNLSEKVDGYKLFMDYLDSKAEYFKKLEGDFYKAKKTCQNQVDRMKESLKFACQQLTRDELLGQFYRFKLSESKPKLKIENPELLPADLCEAKTRTVVDYLPKEDLILQKLQAGEQVPGAKIFSTVSLRSYVNTGKNKKELKDVNA